MNNKEAKKAAQELSDELRDKGMLTVDQKKVAGALYKLCKGSKTNDKEEKQ
jgi:hypothetical protein